METLRDPLLDEPTNPEIPKGSRNKAQGRHGGRAASSAHIQPEFAEFLLFASYEPEMF